MKAKERRTPHAFRLFLEAAEQFEAEKKFEYASLAYRQAANLNNDGKYKNYLLNSAHLLIEEVLNNADLDAHKVLSLLNDAKNACIHLLWKNYKIPDLLRNIKIIYTLKKKYDHENAKSYEAFLTAYQNFFIALNQIGSAEKEIFLENNKKLDSRGALTDESTKEKLSAQYREAGDLFFLAKSFSNAAKAYTNASKLTENPSKKKNNLKLVLECYEILDDDKNAVEIGIKIR